MKKRNVFRKIHPLKKKSLYGADRVRYSILFSIGMVFTLVFFFWWFHPSHIPINFSSSYHGIDIMLFSLVSYIVWYQVINDCFIWVTAFFMTHPRDIPPIVGKRVAFLTAFVPGKEPYDVLKRTLTAMTRASYPHDTWVLDEGDDQRVKNICAELGVYHFSRKGIEKYNTASGNYKAKTKGGNYNAWYDTHGSSYDFVAQIDVDFLPRSDFLTKTLGYFRDPDVAFVGSPQVYGNIYDSWITRGAAQQAYAFHGAMQKGFFGSDMTLFIGANHVIRSEAHGDIEGYAGHIVEDHLTGMKFYKQRWKSVYVPEILAVGEGPSTWDAYFSQQMRWAYGLFDILFTHSPFLFPGMKWIHIINYFLLQQYYFFGLTQVLGIFLISLYLFFGISATSMELFPLLLTYIPLVIWQHIMFLWLQKYNIDPEHEKGMMWEAKILNFAAWPIYFLAFIGVLRGKKLNYAVTPKGEKQVTFTHPSLFFPHMLLGTITLIGSIASMYTGHSAPQILFWAILNTLIMYGLVIHVFYSQIRTLLYRTFLVEITFSPSWKKIFPYTLHKVQNSTF